MEESDFLIIKKCYYSLFIIESVSGMRNMREEDML